MCNFKYFVTSLIIIFLCLFYKATLSQQVDEIKLEDLRTPTAPGFVLLGVEPTAVDKPTTPRDLASTLLSTFKEGKIAPDFAIEFSPYWLCSHPYLTLLDDYLNRNNVGRNIIQNFSISAASSEMNIKKDTTIITGTGVGFGFRTHILSQKAPEETRNYLSKLKQIYEVQFITLILLNVENKLEDNQTVMDKNILLIYLKEVIDTYLNDPSKFSSLPLFKYSEKDKKKLFNQAYDELKTRIEKETVNSQTDAEDLISKIIIEYQRKKITGKVQELKDMNLNNSGFSLELAGGMVTTFVNGQTNQAYITKYGLWLTPCYSLPLQKSTASIIKELNFIGVVRYLWNSNLVDSASYTDIGFRLMYESRKISVSAEGLLRGQIRSLDKEGTFRFSHTNRFSFNLEYQIMNNIYITYSIGKDFEDKSISFSGEQEGNFFTLLGVNFALGRKENFKIEN